MRESIGSTFLYNMILVFLVIVFAFLAGTVSYYKAFKVNSRIAKAIETYEGYNGLSDAEIARVLQTLGYRNGKRNCKVRTEKNAQVTLQKPLDYSSSFDYCLYLIDDKDDLRHYTYGIMTYINIDLPVIGDALKLPIYSKTERIFRFTNT